ncbi:MAG TPA: protein phosphatase 2C domain-containing protein [Ktedonobacteraceae bacterium]|nr:protein phosphatase 2C domain-containing protein [Ktedonobacteraceae bacterium]
MLISMQKNDLRDNMLKIIKVAYLTQKLVRLITWASLLLGSLLFFWFTGGFPPHGWRVLAQAIANLPALWALRGPSVLLPLFVLFAYSLTLLLVWIFLISALLWAMVQQWIYLQTWRRVEQAARTAQQKNPNVPKQAVFNQPGYPRGATPTIHAGRATEYGRGSPSRVPWPSLQRQSSLPETWPHSDNAQFPQQSPSPLVAMPPVLPVARNVRTVNLNPPLSPLLEQALQAQDGVGTMTGPLTQPLLPRTPVTEPQQNVSDAVVALRVGTALDPGITRKEKPNEDHLLAVHGTHTYNADYRPYGLFVVADGMGGHANGQEASRLVIQHIRNAIIPTLLSNVDLDSKHSKELLLEGIQHANLAIYQQNRQQECDMGSTVTAAILVGSMLTVANVGDSRTYLYNPQKGLTQATRDHSMVARLVEKGIIGADEIYTHPQRNQIYRCLGETASVQIDAFSLSYQSGDTLLLCSDGLWEMVRNSRIQEILDKTLPDASLATQSLMQAALEGGGKDNISVIVVHRV